MKSIDIRKKEQSSLCEEKGKKRNVRRQTADGIDLYKPFPLQGEL